MSVEKGIIRGWHTDSLSPWYLQRDGVNLFVDGYAHSNCQILKTVMARSHDEAWEKLNSDGPEKPTTPTRGTT